MTENDIKRIVAETLAKVSSEIHSTTTTLTTQAPKKRNGVTLSWLVPLVVSVIIAVVGWALFIGEKTSDTAHMALQKAVESESSTRQIADSALVKQLDLFTSLATTMRDDIATLKAQMSILMQRMK